MDVHLSLVVPAYNEERRIGESLALVEPYLDSLRQPCEVIVVDDGSTDRTLEIARERAQGPIDLRIITYKPNRGKGYAVRQGMLAARGQLIAFSDADLSAPIEELAKLISALEDGYDIAIGSRAVKGAELTIHQPRHRELGGKLLNLAIRALAVPGIHDTQCGFKLFKGEAARNIFSRCFLNGWAFDVEVLYLARRLGYRVAEIPVRWSHSADSKIRPFRAGLEVLCDTLRVRFHGYPHLPHRR